MNNKYFVTIDFCLDINEQTYEIRQKINETIKEIIKTQLCEELNKKEINVAISNDINPIKVSMQ